MGLALCTGPLAPAMGNLNVAAYKGILKNCVFPTLWLQFGGGIHLGVIVRCPHIFAHILYIKDIYPFNNEQMVQVVAPYMLMELLH